MKKAILTITLVLLIGAILTQGFGCADTGKEPTKGLQGINKGLEQPHNKGLQDKAGNKGFSDNWWDIKLPLKAR